MSEETKALLDFFSKGNAHLSDEIADLRTTIGALSRELAQNTARLEGLRDQLTRHALDLGDLRTITLACPARLNYRDDTQRIQTLEKGKVSKVTGAGAAFQRSESIDWTKIAKMVGLAVGTAAAATATALLATR